MQEEQNASEHDKTTAQDIGAVRYTADESQIMDRASIQNIHCWMV